MKLLQNINGSSTPILYAPVYCIAFFVENQAAMSIAKNVPEGTHFSRSSELGWLAVEGNGM